MTTQPDTLQSIIAELRDPTRWEDWKDQDFGADIADRLERLECTIVHSDPPTAPDFLAVGTVNQWREMCGD